MGDSGTSKSGEVHHYYACGKKKKERACKKLNEKKEFLEWYVVEQTVEYVLAPVRMEYIADRIVDQYEKSLGGSKVKDMEHQLDKLELDIDNAVDASISSPRECPSKVF